MSVPSVLLGMAIAFALSASIAAVMLASSLAAHGVRTPFPFLGVLVFRNLREYRRITRERTGHTGPLFYAYVVPINAALACAVAAALTYGLGI